MKYNFKVQTTLSEAEVSSIVGPVAEGLQATNEVVLAITLNLNTELPQELEANLTELVSGFVTDKLDQPATAELVSKQF